MFIVYAGVLAGLALTFSAQAVVGGQLYNSSTSGLSFASVSSRQLSDLSSAVRIAVTAVFDPTAMLVCRACFRGNVFLY